MQGAGSVLRERYADVREEDGYIRIYDVDDTASVVDFLMKNGHVVSEIKKNKIGLEEYYVELMSRPTDEKEAES
jgi:alpha-D-ribose 1-methylphosphonate 5-triphosphate synthase subunit PhnL